MRVITATLAAALVLAGASACSNDTTDGKATTPTPAPAKRTAASSASAAKITDPGAAAKTDPCTLVTQDEADAIAGRALKPKARAQQTCTFASPTDGSPAQLEVYVGDGAKKFYEIDRDSLSHKFTDVPDVGDEAHLEDGAIFVASKNTWFGLRLLRLDSVDTGPELIKLAKTAAGRL